ncbi:MAG: saccharopine dehydrogenase NADP-binding domain-containing protein, partial [Phycisphaerales bacterium]|nr:saccharopine dehydrogenase NADP-binding domain-containing protein [Phycisphaerales bacterium]
MPDAIVLGAGMVGSVMACDLAADADFNVTIADVRPGALAAAQRRAARLGVTLSTLEADLGDVDVLRGAIEPFDIVLGALASVIGFQTLRTVIESGKHFCDICF